MATYHRLVQRAFSNFHLCTQISFLDAATTLIYIHKSLQHIDNFIQLSFEAKHESFVIAA